MPTRKPLPYKGKRKVPDAGDDWDEVATANKVKHNGTEEGKEGESDAAEEADEQLRRGDTATDDEDEENEQDQPDGSEFESPTSDEGDVAQEGDDSADGDYDDPVQEDAATGTPALRQRRDHHAIAPYPLERRAATRVYSGPLRHGARYTTLRDVMYGPEYARIRIAWEMDRRWARYPVLPPRHPPAHPHGIVPSPWLPPGFEADNLRSALLWYDGYQRVAAEQQRERVVPLRHAARLVPQDRGDLVALLGPWDRQKEVRFSQGQAIAVSACGLPLDDRDVAEKTPAGWMFDTGALVLAMAWAPIPTGNVQLLALATAPHSDYDLFTADGAAAESGQADTAGTIQFWEFVGERNDEAGRLSTPSRTLPRLRGVKCFDWDRPKRIQWCPAPLLVAGSYGQLAVLCGDGKARVIDIRVFEDSGKATPRYEWIESPAATLGLTNEYCVEATCLTWVNINRLALGHRDGTVTLWSVHPRQLLQRIPMVATQLVDICSAYPSNPYVIAAVPVGGCLTLADLSHPTSQTTYVATPGLNFQPGLLAWSEPLQGFVVRAITVNPSHIAIAFHNLRFFTVARQVVSASAALTCLAVGATHPFVLAGCVDGALWCCNALAKVFKQRGETPFKIRVLENEFRRMEGGEDDEEQMPDHAAHGGKQGHATRRQEDASSSPPPTDREMPLRGAIRILQGFLPEANADPRVEKRVLERKQRRKARGKAKAATRGRRRPSQKTLARAEAEGVAADGSDGEEAEESAEERQDDTADGIGVPASADSGHNDGSREADGMGPHDRELIETLQRRGVIHEPLTRITAAAWNPNLDFSCWAACAMGSGLVRIMDLGVE